MPKRAKYEFTSSFLNVYKEVKIIGEGGNSTVFKVIDDENNEYALKLLNKKIDKENKKRFKNEINYCLKSNHENIMNITDVGIYELKDQKYMFYVMPVFDGNLREMMKNGIKNEDKLFYFNQILEGIKYFHNGNNYHRDIKPENILFDKIKNLLVVADFGISHFNDDELYTVIETKVGSRMANFQYASPEQKERGAEVDHRADIYALGLILNELFTGHVPFGTSYKKIAEVAPEYSFLDEVVEEMIKQDKNERPKNIETVQYEINSRIELEKANAEIKRLRKIEIKDSEEKDILITDPPKIVNVTYDEFQNRLRFELSHPINNDWISCLKSGTREEIMEYGIDRFRFEYEYASVPLPIRDLDYVQKITNHFKQWINNANSNYPILINKKRSIEKLNKEKEIKAEIQKKEKIAKALNNITF